MPKWKAYVVYEGKKYELIKGHWTSGSFNNKSVEAAMRLPAGSAKRPEIVVECFVKPVKPLKRKHVSRALRKDSCVESSSTEEQA